MPRRKQSAPQPIASSDEPRVIARSTEISFIEPPAADEAQIPEQRQHFQLPTRFGAVPVDEAPLGWEVETRPREVKVTKFQHAYLYLPTRQKDRPAGAHRAVHLPEGRRGHRRLLGAG